MLLAHPEVLALSTADPCYYVAEVLGRDLHSFQPDFLRSVRDYDETAVRSANGVGKSIALAYAASWFLDCFESKVLITAPVHRQCESTYRYFKEFRRTARYELPGVCMEQPFCRIGENYYAQFFTAKDAAAFAGPHAARMFLGCEEAGGLPEDIYTGVYGCAQGEHDRIAHLGNPWSNGGTFVGLWKGRREEAMRAKRLRLFTVSALDSPNVKLGRDVVPGLVSRKAVDRLAERFGKSSDVYRVRVLGLPPRQDSASVIPLAAWEAAKLRGEKFAGEEHPIVGRPRAGLDLGGGGDGDPCAFVERDDVRVRRARTWSGESLAVSREVARAWLIGNPTGALAIDAGGLGLDTAEQLLNEFGGRVVAVQFGGAQIGEDDEDFLVAAGSDDRVPLYANRRAEIWHKAGRWLEGVGELDPSIETDLLQELEEDLLCPRWKPQARGQLLIEPKEETRKRLGRSPNLGDALALSVAADFEECVATAGAGTSIEARIRSAEQQVQELRTQLRDADAANPVRDDAAKRLAVDLLEARRDLGRLVTELRESRGGAVTTARGGTADVFNGRGPDNWRRHG
jgi:hypothetical protein